MHALPTPSPLPRLRPLLSLFAHEPDSKRYQPINLASKGTLDALLEIGWVKMRGRRKTPGRPVTYGTTEAFLSHFGLNEVSDLPGLQELKGAGLLEANLPPGFDMPIPRGSDELTAGEDPLDGTEMEQPPLEMHFPEQAGDPPAEG